MSNAVTTPSLYAQYLTERCGYEILEVDDGFVTFEMLDTAVYIRDIFVVPSARRNGLASRMADQVCAIAQGRGCLTLLGTIDPTTHGAHESLLGLLAYGMRLSHLSGGLIVLTKPLGEKHDGNGR